MDACPALIRRLSYDSTTRMSYYSLREGISEPREEYDTTSFHIGLSYVVSLERGDEASGSFGEPQCGPQSRAGFSSRCDLGLAGHRATHVAPRIDAEALAC